MSEVVGDFQRDFLHYYINGKPVSALLAAMLLNENILPSLDEIDEAPGEGLTDNDVTKWLQIEAGEAKNDPTIQLDDGKKDRLKKPMLAWLKEQWNEERLQDLCNTYLFSKISSEESVVEGFSNASNKLLHQESLMNTLRSQLQASATKNHYFLGQLYYEDEILRIKDKFTFRVDLDAADGGLIITETIKFKGNLYPHDDMREEAAVIKKGNVVYDANLHAKVAYRVQMNSSRYLEYKKIADSVASDSPSLCKKLGVKKYQLIQESRSSSAFYKETCHKLTDLQVLPFGIPGFVLT